MQSNGKNAIRILAGVYLIYTGASLIEKILDGQPEHLPIFFGAAAIFIGFGLWIAISDTKILINRWKVRNEVSRRHEQDEMEDFHKESEAKPVKRTKKTAGKDHGSNQSPRRHQLYSEEADEITKNRKRVNKKNK